MLVLQFSCGCCDEYFSLLQGFSVSTLFISSKIDSSCCRAAARTLFFGCCSGAWWTPCLISLWTFGLLCPQHVALIGHFTWWDSAIFCVHLSQWTPEEQTAPTDGMDLKNLQGQWAAGRQCWPLDATRKPRSDTKMTPHLPRHTVSAFTLWSWVIWRAAQSAPCNALHFYIISTFFSQLSPPCHRTFRNSRCQQISCRENVERHTQADHISWCSHSWQ